MYRLAAAIALLAGCKVKDPPPITQQWHDGFERTDLGPNYLASGDGYEVKIASMSHQPDRLSPR